MDAERRGRLGAFYTPPEIVAPLLDAALTPTLASCRSADDVLALRVLDPACGAGAFLAPAKRRIVDRLSALSGVSVAEAARAVEDAGCVVGWDIDPDAIAACADAIGGDRWLRRADPLLEAPEPVFDVVIGNPPFLDQLDRRTAIDTDRRAALAERYPIASYTDLAALFLLYGVRSLRAGGYLCMIQPLSALGARDTDGIRREVDGLAALESIWVGGGRVFPDANAQVCAVGVVRSGERTAVRLLVGGAFRDAGTVQRGVRSWAALGAAAMGVPDVQVDGDRTIGDLAQAGADFREAFYRLASVAVEGDGSEERRRIATTGLIDPAMVRWGEHEVRFAGERYTHPLAGPSPLTEDGEALESWIIERAVPKLLVASQTRVIEAAMDTDGTYLPATPLIWVIPQERDDLARLCAILLSPVATALAATEGFGTAMSPQAIKLTAGRVRSLPLPTRDVPWNEAASLVDQAHRASRPHERLELVERAGVLMLEAYDVDDTSVILPWWRERLHARGQRG